MSIASLWIPDWRTDAVFSADFSALLLHLSPRVRIESRGVIWADVRGMAAERVGRELLNGARALEVPGARCGIGSVPIVAEGAARFGASDLCLVGAGREAEFLAPLPLTLLTREEVLLGWLQGAGLRECGELAALSAEAVEVRFGGAAVELWRRARGEDRRHLFLPIPPERLSASVDFVDYSIRDATQLVFTLNALLEQICEGLRERAQRARSLTLRFALTGGGQLEKVLRTARPTADRTLWIRRLRAVLEGVRLQDTISGVALEVGDCEAISSLQGDLFDRGFATASFVEEAVARLLDRYRGLFLRAEASRHPLLEHRARWVELTPEEITKVGEPDAGELSGKLELRLLPEPRRLQVESRTRRDHLLPLRYLEGGEWHRLHSAGPDRVSGGHAQERPYAREYFRCFSDTGALLWIYRDAVEDRWYLHGWWD